MMTTWERAFLLLEQLSNRRRRLSQHPLISPFANSFLRRKWRQRSVPDFSWHYLKLSSGSGR